MKIRTLTMASIGLLLISGGTVGAAAGEPEPSGPAELDASQVAEYKKAQDAAGLGPGLGTDPVPRLTAEQAQLEQAKLDSDPAQDSKSETAAAVVVAAAPAQKILSATHSSQSKTYWCGPSAVAMALRAGGLTSPTQTVLAGQLKTTTNGTDWSGKNITAYPATGRPVKDVLNGRFSSFFYAAVDLSYSPTSAEKANYKSRLVSTVWLDHALVGGAMEVPGGPRLNGHPAGNTQIWHYITMLGYKESGAKTRYGDPASGSATSWAGNVPAKSDISSNTMATVLGGRGYVW